MRHVSFSFTMLVMTIGARIKARRVALKKSQPDVAKHFGITRNAVSQWENDETLPDTKRLFELAPFLKADLVWLITGEPSGNNLSDAERAALKILNLLDPDDARTWLLTGNAMLGTDRKIEIPFTAA